MEPRRSSNRVYVLDGLRLLAALMVVAWHLVAGFASRAFGAPTSDLFGLIYPLARYGWLGVELFFVISGFVICMSSWGRTVGEFAISRVVRLYPAYWFAVLATTAVVTALPTYTRHLSVTETLANLTMLQEFVGIGHVDQVYWTLTIELLFYVLFAIVVARGVTYRRVVAFCAVWTLGALIAARFQDPVVGFVFGSAYAHYFIAGAALYLTYRFGQSLLLWGIVGASWVLALVRLRDQVAGYGAQYKPAAAVVTVIFAVMALVSVGAFDRIRWRWLVTAGSLTYPLYLLHEFIGLTVIAALRQYLTPWALLGSVVGGLLITAWLVHMLVERPVARVLKRGLTQALAQARADGRRPEPEVATDGHRPEPEPEVTADRNPVIAPRRPLDDLARPVPSTAD